MSSGSKETYKTLPDRRIENKEYKMDLGVHTSQPIEELMTLNKDQNDSIK